MKLILMALILGIASFAQAEETCIFQYDDSYGAIVVKKVAKLEVGGAAYNDDPQIQTRDIKRFAANARIEMTALNQATRALDVVYELGVEVPWKQVQSAQVVVLDSKKNRLSLSGGMIITLFDAKKNILAKVGQLGQGAGVCQ